MTQALELDGLVLELKFKDLIQRTADGVTAQNKLDPKQLLYAPHRLQPLQIPNECLLQ